MIFNCNNSSTFFLFHFDSAIDLSGTGIWRKRVWGQIVTWTLEQLQLSVRRQGCLNS